MQPWAWEATRPPGDRDLLEDQDKVRWDGLVELSANVRARRATPSTSKGMESLPSDGRPLLPRSISSVSEVSPPPK